MFIFKIKQLHNWVEWWEQMIISHDTIFWGILTELSVWDLGLSWTHRTTEFQGCIQPYKLFF